MPSESSPLKAMLHFGLIFLLVKERDSKKSPHVITEASIQIATPHLLVVLLGKYYRFAFVVEIISSLLNNITISEILKSSSNDHSLL